MKNFSYFLIALTIAAVTSSCSTNTNVTDEPLAAEYVNPYPVGTYDHFLARLDYKKTHDIYRDETGYANASSNETSIVLDLKDLRGRLYNGNKKVILDYPISSGTKKNPTPLGNFKITEKIEDKESNLYGKIYDANGSLVTSNADSRKDIVPEGGKFDGADMPYWMRLTGSGIGMHQGRVPRYPASHGCIRHTMSGVTQVYKKVRVGTPVTIK